MSIVAKTFLELTTSELYEILKSRNEVFLLEQNIVCQELDDVDYKAIHIFEMSGNRVSSYLRAFKTEADTACIGRVLTLERGRGDGRRIMEFALDLLKKDYKRVSLHAQTQAAGFYEKLGFKEVSDEYLEEGVPHVTMLLKLYE